MQRFPESTLVLVTGEAELERGVTQDLTQAWSDLPMEHWDSLPLAELARRLPSCSHFLGHDSGMSHLAAACGVPVHSFFASHRSRHLGRAESGKPDPSLRLCDD